MNEQASAIWSEYIIDGTRMISSPGEILNTASREKNLFHKEGINITVIIDETIDPPPSSNSFDKNKIEEYRLLTSAAQNKPRTVSPAYPDFMAKSIISSALLSSIWRKGHFCLKDLALSASWEWNTSPIGNMSAFYRSVETACDYLGALGLALKSFSFKENSACTLSFNPVLDDFGDEAEDLSDNESFFERPVEKPPRKLEKTRKCSKHISGNEDSWIIYIPFETCNFRLGASLLSEVTAKPGGKSPDLNDTEYFADCFEVVRELVEDGIVKAGATVGSGGLMTALGEMIPEGKGLSADISGLMKSYAENDVVSILFGEVPGVVIEIDDADYDYIDAEFLLQDVAYYPLGHPSLKKSGLHITTSDLSDISAIMLSLINNRFL